MSVGLSTGAGKSIVKDGRVGLNFWLTGGAVGLLYIFGSARWVKNGRRRINPYSGNSPTPASDLSEILIFERDSRLSVFLEFCTSSLPW
jgi:hypothetical protein